MNFSSNSIRLYEELASIAKNRSLNVPAAHNSLFQPSANTEEYINKLYIKQLGSENPAQRPGDQNCQYCENFHLETAKSIDKSADISLGKKLEDCFQEFIEERFNSIGVEIQCLRADSERKNMPDFKIVRKSDNKILLYFEFKAIFRPYLTIKYTVDRQFECYSNSLTLDLSNGKKLQTQRDYVVNELGVDKVFYVYWYDLPCIKGVYWLPSQQVYDIMDIQIPYDRVHKPGDFNKYGKKIGSTNKLYLPLNKMADLGTFLRRIYNWNQTK